MLKFIYIPFLMILISCSTNETLVNYNQNPEEVTNLGGSWEYIANHNGQQDLNEAIN